jgi:3-oxoacyl-[acyl-carrier protein] reductase/meso-butanediol dehydrogenase/(S,S)-butanediol dehydrogenase/diacetyl reductase
MAELAGKVAIITGAGRRRSIGHATAIALAELGADVVVTGTGRDPATFPEDERAVGWRDVESTADDARRLGRRALPLVVDVTDWEQVDRMVQRTLAELGRIDILVNNAAMPRGRDRVPVVDLEPDVFQRVVDVKVRGTYLCTKAVARVLIEQGQGGKIVTVASMAGKRGAAHALAYNAANFAQVGMTQSLAQELGKHRINVNCICPAAVDTSRMDMFGRGERWQQIAAALPIGRNGTPQEVGGFIAFLCTQAASWIHGQSINIDGGAVMEH